MIEYIKNLNTGRVLEATERLIEYAHNKDYLVLCDAEGNKVLNGADNPLQAENERLEEKVRELEAELELLRAEKGETPVIETEVALTPEETEVNKIDALVDAMAYLDQNNPDHFNKSGLPTIEALVVFSNIEDISAAERTEAWQRFSQ